MTTIAHAEDISLPFEGDGPDDVLTIRAWRFRGSGGGPRVHLQAGVHGNEIPGMVVLDMMLQRLSQAVAAGTLRGDITIAPQANPLALRQNHAERVNGRFHTGTGRNFNRHFPASIAHPASSAHAAWQSALASLSTEADYVLDLHTDEEAIPYLYIHADLWPAGKALAAFMQTEVAILWSGDDGTTFEDIALNRLRGRGGDAPYLSATLELRGESDTDPQTVAADCDGLYGYLCHIGAIDEAVAVPAWGGLAVPAAHMETTFAPTGGIVVFQVRLGQAVRAGDTVARLLPRPGEDWISLTTLQDGVILSRMRDRIAAKGMVVLKQTGDRPSATYTGGALDDAPGR